MKRTLAVVVGALVVSLGLARPAQSAIPVTCGSTVTVSAKLTRNITNCPSDPAITINGDNLTLDLNGHTVDGTGIGVGIKADGQDHINIVNGTVKEFATAVEMDNGHVNFAKKITVRFATFGFKMSGSVGDGGVIRSSVLGGSTAVTIVDSGGNDVVRANKLLHATTAGVSVEGASDHVLVSGNQIIGPGNSGTGVSLNTTVPSFSQVAHNTISAFGVGVLVGSSSVNQYVLQNTTRNNGVHGIWIVAGADDIEVGGNHANGNAVDGVFVQTTNDHTKIGSNIANSNGSYGIEASPVNDDAGGNRAKGNKRPEQCLNVICL